MQLAIFYVSQFFFIVLGITLLAFQVEWQIVIGLIVFRYLFAWLSLGFSAGKLLEKDVMYWYPVLEIVLIFMQINIFFTNLVSKPIHWR